MSSARRHQSGGWKEKAAAPTSQVHHHVRGDLPHVTLFLQVWERKKRQENAAVICGSNVLADLFVW